MAGRRLVVLELTAAERSELAAMAAVAARLRALRFVLASCWAVRAANGTRTWLPG